MAAGKINWYGEQVKRKIANHTEQVLRWGGVKMEADIKRRIGKRGTTRKSGAGKGTHSKDFQPPFRQKSGLINSIASQIVKTTKNIVLQVGSTLRPEGGALHSYAWYLEKGTAKMKKRPYLTPALRKWSKIILRKLRIK